MSSCSKLSETLSLSYCSVLSATLTYTSFCSVHFEALPTCLSVRRFQKLCMSFGSELSEALRPTYLSNWRFRKLYMMSFCLELSEALIMIM